MKGKKRVIEQKDFAAARLATTSATCWTGIKLFFKGGLYSQPVKVLAAWA